MISSLTNVDDRLLDTSAVVPLIIDEASTERCNRLWNEATRVVSVRLRYPEARAALARAERAGRVTRRQLAASIAELAPSSPRSTTSRSRPGLAHAAGELAQIHLRGYDAVHLAAARTVADTDLVVVTGDADLAVAATAVGIAVAVTNA